GGEVHRDAPERELEASVLDRRADALARLLHRCVGQADDVEGGQPAADVDLDINGDTLDAAQRGTTDLREAHRRPFVQSRRAAQPRACYPNMSKPHPRA